MKGYSGIAVAGLLAVIAVFLGIMVVENAEADVALDARYVAVLLVNGQAYFGRIEHAGSDYPVLKDVYYVQQVVNTETKEATNQLVKRGQEWHAPDRMVLNARHILFIEPVTETSQVFKLIEESRRQSN